MILLLTGTDLSVYQANDGTATAEVSGGTEPYSYVWDTDPVQTEATAINLPPGTYTVIVTDSAGCKVSDTITISDAPNVFAVPNAFSPNGDGLNDEFTVIQSNVSEFEMFIFNRWGELLYYTTDLNEGWDGRYEQKEAEIGAYVYVIKAAFFDGSSLEKKGNVTLLR
jgi:gliding motility-associated-like protein